MNGKVDQLLGSDKLARKYRGSLPYGYGYSINGYVINDEQARTVNMIYKKYAIEKKTIRQICEELNNMGIPAARGNTWRPSSVVGVLTNEVYTGELRQSDNYIHLPPIVPRELYDQVQLQRKRNKRLSVKNTKHKYLLHGILHCALCNEKMKSISRRLEEQGKIRISYEYICPNCSINDKSNGFYKKIVLDAKKVDQMFWHELVKYIKELKFDNLIMELKNSLFNVEREISCINNNITKMIQEKDSSKTLIEGDVNTKEDNLTMQNKINVIIEHSKHRKRQLEREKLRLEYNLQQWNFINTTIMLLKEKHNNYYNYEEKRKIIKQLIESIVVDPKENSVCFQSQGYVNICFFFNNVFSNNGGKKIIYNYNYNNDNDGLDGRKRRVEESRSLILEAAREIFLEKGYKKSTILQISEKAGVGYGTIYNHFSGKEDILVCLLNDIITDFSKNAEMDYKPENIEHVDKMNFQEQTYFMKLAIKHRPLLKVLKEAARYSSRLEEYIDQVFQRYVDKAVTGIGYSQQKGIARPLNKNIMAKCKIFLLKEFFWDIVFEKENDPEMIISNIVSLFNTGLYLTGCRNAGRGSELSEYGTGGDHF